MRGSDIYKFQNPVQTFCIEFIFSIAVVPELSHDSGDLVAWPPISNSPLSQSFPHPYTVIVILQQSLSKPFIYQFGNPAKKISVHAAVSYLQ
jgi:hypothetical protein